MENISSKMVKGAAWMVAFKIVERSIGTISTIILARLLEPGDFGLVSLATAFLALLYLLTNFSFDVALIQKQDAERHLYDTAWTFNVIFGFLLGLILLGAAIPLSVFYHEARLENILYILAVSTFLSGFNNIGPVAFRKQLQFHKEFYFLLAKKLISFTVCMILAFTLRNYWALVWGTFAGKILEILLSYRVHPYRPRFCLTGRKELFGFSMWLFFNNTIFFAYHRMADFIISKLLGGHALGIYTLSYEISNLPTTELVAPINRAVLPGYSKMAHDYAALRQGFLNVLSVIALFALPAGLGIAVVAEPLVMVVLGAKWREAIPLIQILAISGSLMAMQTNASVIYNATGKPRIMSIVLFIHVVLLFFPMLVFFLHHEGIIGIAKAYLFSNLIIWPINYYLAMRLVSVKCLAVLAVLYRPLMAAILMCFTAKAIYPFLAIVGIQANSLLGLILFIIYGALIYFASLLALWQLANFPDGAENFILKKLKIRH